MSYGAGGPLGDRDIQNLAEQLLMDIDKIIKCLETTHKNSSIARITGYTLAGIGTAIGALAAGVVIVPAGVVAAVGTVITLTGTVTSLGASLFEGINERRKLKTIQKQMEMLKEHIPAYVLYSDMIDPGFMSGGMMSKVTGDGKGIFTAYKEVSAMLSALLGSKASAECLKVNKTLLITNVGASLMILHRLFTEGKSLYQGQPTEVIKLLRVLKSELEHIARGCRYQDAKAS